MKRIAVVIIALVLLSFSASAQDSYILSPRLGIAHISTAEEVTSRDRYETALALGAGWNRCPIYWYRVEPEPGRFVWDDYDRLVRDDLAYGLQINAILLGSPAFHKTGVRIDGLQKPIFGDGSDRPAPGKALNPDNPWASFVYQAVTRYKPGGMLAVRENWSPEQGIRVWEIWNEPDFKLFWDGPIIDYARLLKVAYIVAKQVDPDAQIMFGGLLFGTDDNWLAQVLAIFEDDPLRERYNWYFDMVAVHNYSYPWRSAWLVRVINQTLKAYKLDRPVWLNESGAPVWDDYPGPIWAEPAERQLRATALQQAYFFVQSTAYAWAEGADVVFFHQLYDDCGNQPGGTDFPAHEGELCAAGGFCMGDAFGLYRNPRGSVCFSQHPLPGTARPAAAAFELMAQLFGEGLLENPRARMVEGKAIVISFDRPGDNQRAYIAWNRSLEKVTVQIPAAGNAGLLYSLDQRTLLLPDTTGNYQLTLPPAACDYFPFLETGDNVAIGGAPLILLDRLSDAPPAQMTLEPTETPTQTKKVSRNPCALP